MSKCEQCKRMVDGECTHPAKNKDVDGKIVPFASWVQFKGEYPPFADYCSDVVIQFYEKWLILEQPVPDIDWGKINEATQIVPMPPMPYITDQPTEIWPADYNPNVYRGGDWNSSQPYCSNEMSVTKEEGDCPLCN